ncbi:hypothetical protein ASPWEDRAFT_26526 [Aspergillus wentii DTO 134E9]|uniref:Uncharacterized protein n=1 Tax=Aspergillus wentii DTO 134E9 TaxID=1073089 RepID=A0A1L9RQA9_ASPWE|nr:uncharacterized protein ASPWEDRAFT_26526 [Aspergillus wentii DTO 134E9]OJJ37114.1 hypothetical protein ASPWEDRAFT_26526 [Aspergillus wentii DTO 134E9]
MVWLRFWVWLIESMPSNHHGSHIAYQLPSYYYPRPPDYRRTGHRTQRQTPASGDARKKKSRKASVTQSQRQGSPPPTARNPEFRTPRSPYYSLRPSGLRALIGHYSPGGPRPPDPSIVATSRRLPFC